MVPARNQPAHLLAHSRGGPLQTAEGEAGTSPRRTRPEHPKISLVDGNLLSAGSLYHRYGHSILLDPKNLSGVLKTQLAFRNSSPASNWSQVSQIVRSLLKIWWTDRVPPSKLLKIHHRSISLVLAPPWKWCAHPTRSSKISRNFMNFSQCGAKMMKPRHRKFVISTKRDSCSVDTVPCLPGT